MPLDPERVPVIVGVGQINDRPADPLDGMGALRLTATALMRADADAGGGWLAAADTLAVVQQIGMPEQNPLADRLADAVGATVARMEESDGPNGDSPVLLLNDAANRIAGGEARIVVIAGGEALRTTAARARAARAEPNPLRRVTTAPGYRQRHGLSAPVDVYPLYENAARAAWGQALAEGQAETGAIWSLMSEVAARTPAAWLRTPLTPAEIMTPSAANRRIAFPYTKLTVANASVDQGAAFLVTSLAEARRRGVPEHRLVFVGRGARACEPADILARNRYDRSASLTACLHGVLAANGVTAADLDLVELYSCFPCMPKLARRAIGWPLDRPVTVFGGLTFGGGPIGNYMSHATACMVEALRAGRGARGLLFGNGGYATRNHALLLATTPPADADRPHDYDRQAEADVVRAPVPPLEKEYEGLATVETYTVFYARDGTPTGGVVIARSPGGGRTLARVVVEDAAAIAFLTSGKHEPVGAAGLIRADAGERVWRFA